ncbi:MAG: purine-nucleoside/S-methyl-5-thioadenosine phosphorylase / adenosine deaminase, partial [Acidobacteriota bacterium]|nr:purine-nucleoside/S-methyl-5-thioadenosine phosphorylase / adenosine deaminase [Acidobacteriota bacterium]
GPTIRVCCFEVGEEVVAEFTAAYEGAERFVDRSHAKPHIDLAALTADVLRHRGFTCDRISDSGLCTRCEGSVFHSYRRDGKGGGRNLQVVAQ